MQLYMVTTVHILTCYSSLAALFVRAPPAELSKDSFVPISELRSALGIEVDKDAHAHQ